MPAKMTEEQLAFWRELMAPFRDDELSVKKIGGRDLTYIDKRSLANRLDSVLGPDGWFPEYRDEGGRGLVCRLHLCVPTGPNGSRVFMYKEEGGADEGMTKKTGGDNVEDVDNNFKSEFTNAFRRAAQDAWGIGRYLYQKGIPDFLDPRARPAQASAPVQAPPRQEANAPQEFRPQNAGPIAPQPQGGQPAPAPQSQPQGTFNNFKIPPPGKSVFRWAKEMETAFDTRIINGMQDNAKEQGWATVFADWNAEQVAFIATDAIAHIKTLPTYKGQFDHVDTGGQPAAQAQAPVAQVQPTVNNVVQPNLGDLRKKLMDLMQEHVVKSIGRQANPTELKASFYQIATHCPTGAGFMGRIPDSLSGLNDVIWLENMISFVQDQIRNCVPPQEGAAQSSEIPF